MVIAGGLFAATALEKQMISQESNRTSCCIYRVENPTLGPIDGRDVVALFLDRSGIRQAYSLRDGHLFASDESVPGWEEVRQILEHSITPDAPIRIDTDRDHKTVAGVNGTTVHLLRCTQKGTVCNSIDEERMAFLQNHHALWHRSRPTGYRFTLMDSSLKRTHPNGIEITVHDGKAVLAIDVWSQKPIDDLLTIPFGTIDETYEWLKKCVGRTGISRVSIDYDDNCGFPRYIRCTPAAGETRTVSIARCKEQ
jgi:hypothetical protein